MSLYSAGIEEVLAKYSVSASAGLPSGEARARLERQGPNELKAKKKKTLFQRFLDQFKDVMILILIAAAVVSFVVALGGHDAKEFFEPALILVIVVLNAILGVAQESKAEKALDALQGLSAPHARVVRDGAEQIIDAVQVVPGDIILVEAGDFIPADARLLESASLKSEESALTGESVPSEKDAAEPVEDGAPLGDRHNMLYSGCSVTYGRGRAVVTATGMDTEMGKIAGLLDNEQDTQTPLQQKLAKLGKYLGILALIVCAVIFAVGMIDGIPLLEIFMTSVSLAVSAIPEGLPAIVTIVLSIGVQRMVKKNAIIRRLPAVETLGSASVICSDKTGTLTQNRMTLVKAFDGDSGVMEDISEQNSPVIRTLLRDAALCCDGSVVFEDGREKHIGDPTETSIVLAAYKNGMPKEKLNADFPRLSELPFDSDRKLMTTVNRIDGDNVVIVKGAFDMLATRCVSGDLEKAREVVDTLSSQALRVLAVAVKVIDTAPQVPTSEELENGLHFLGLVGMIDPPRPEAREAVKICRKAGIQPVMITGDHVVTASAIAKDLGIQLDGDDAITGAELSAMSEEELQSRVRTISVYARVSPEDKIRIVKAWQSQGEVVSMTGDGVNDAPALKAADIGCAMGITGTDVAKGAADMTLTDDNFATIVDAVKEGRGIYENIKKVVAFLLGTNIGEVLTVFIAMLIWRQSPLLSMQLLWINLITDSLPAIALGMEAVESDVMDHRPKPKSEGIFAHGLGVRIVLQGALFGLLSLIAFWIGKSATGVIEGGRTMAFIVLALSQVVHSFNMRSHHSLFKTGFFSNKYLNGAAAISVVLMALVVFIPPVATVFGLIQLSAPLYLEALGLALVPLVVLELSKALGLIKHHK
ncbi:calcium-translocating P-type ATPase, PMCA-type [Oscillospiraceae bacterium NSJ-54]|uniref:P-type Ca(2+) transporter n=1 Tax=Zongyangia hominis TaxID=2763677 RepID=A0A926EEW0_9FIRM|nr:calcium-translocating P-type ATPase, PMCA-type [Zongyangia hominis]MBC8570801.1 calcium-translocating P-type ATPase, PMCA-type [Zongyangia hominis]